MKQFLLLLFTTLLLFTCYSQVKIIPFQELVNSNGAATGSGIFFGASMSTSTITVTFVGPADRWIALGFGASFMSGADALIYSNGVSGNIHALSWKDYMNSSSTTSLDTQQDWTILSTSSATSRTVTASRVLNTGDPKDVVISYTSSALSLIWARGATADYTIATHGTNNRAYGISLSWQSQPTASFTANQTTICAGSSVTFSNNTTGGSTTYQWAFQGGSPGTATATSPTVSYSTAGTYSVVLTASNAVGTSTFTQINYIVVNPTVQPSASALISNGNNTMCAGSPISFSVTTNNAGATPSFQWKVNGTNAGGNSSTFSPSSFPTGTNNVVCVVTPSIACPIPAIVTSSAIQVTVYPIVTPAVTPTIIAGSNPFCNGTSVTFSANPTQGGANPMYQWIINGVASGTGATITTPTMSSNFTVQIILTSNAVCANSPTAASTLQMTQTSSLPVQLFMAIASGNNPSCTGKTVLLQANGTNGGNATYVWKLNGSTVGANSSTYSTSSLTNGDAIDCTMYSGLACATPTSINVSKIFTVFPTPPAPTVSIAGPGTICPGATTTLVATGSGMIIWSNGTNTFTNSVTQAGTYSCYVTSVQNCQSPVSNSVEVFMYPLTAVSLSPIGPICKDDQPLLLQGGTPPGGQYFVNGAISTTLDPQAFGNAAVTVSYDYTDTNNCTNQATVSLLVSDCLGISQSLADEKAICFPNPGNGILELKTMSKAKHLTAWNSNGTMVVDENVACTDCSFVITGSAGIYFIEIRTESGIEHVKYLKQ